ncbi:MAG: peptidoglycan-associated lipoprotein Pal [candidate division Zixibacteria bacterium]|nr:peptidoglycan-associated lipoprotein Pal [candidate division Zixibacteria bacterium]MDD5424909.1 peptidoglycan-associated lipoprotein Pal [candidate division Zixibacteria bacterium]
MKRISILLLLGVFLITALVVSCGKPKKVQEETTPPPVITEPEIKPEPEPTPPPPPVLKESQFVTVYFDFDKFNLRSDARAALDKNFNLLQEFPNAIIKIEGHCDERGTIEYNLSLGEKRAKAAMDYLLGLGINQARISIISYGKERPAVQGSNENAWAKNRRCEFKIISQ